MAKERCSLYLGSWLRKGKGVNLIFRCHFLGLYASRETNDRTLIVIKVAAGDTLRFGLTFRPERPREHSFQLPLSLEGIPSEGTRRLCVPVHAVGLKPTLKFTSTEVDFGRRIVSRDPCALKQYQGEFVLKNVSEKVGPIKWGQQGSA